MADRQRSHFTVQARRREREEVISSWKNSEDVYRHGLERSGSEAVLGQQYGVRNEEQGSKDDL